MDKKDFINEEITKLEKQIIGEKRRAQPIADEILARNPAYSRLMGIQDALYDRIDKFKKELLALTEKEKEPDKIVSTDTGTETEESS